MEASFHLAAKFALFPLPSSDGIATWSALYCRLIAGLGTRARLRQDMQLSIQRQLTELPKFRLQGLGFTAFVEGWALYAEQLGKEIGFYQDPITDYGRLSSELFRAVRLVVDTGIHSKEWTRDQVVEFMRKSGAVDEPTIQSETDRYIAWPAQACSYKIGQLKFLELRERARKQLGPKFDIRTFHVRL